MSDVIHGIPAGVAIRPVQAVDVAHVAAIERLTFADPWAPEAFASFAERGPDLFFVALETSGGEEVVGYTVASQVGDEAEVLNLAVAKEARNRGIGGALLEALTSALEARGARVIFLEVRESNRAACALYGCRGFVEAGRRKGYYRRPTEDALILRRTLDERSAGTFRLQ